MKKNDAKNQNSQNVNAQTEENYGFIKEERVPQPKWQKRKKFLRSAAIVICLAVLFGVIARASSEVTALVMNKFFSKGDEKIEVNIHPTPDIQITPGGTENIVDEKAFENYENIMRGVRNTTKALAPCMVKVNYIKDIVDPVFSDISESISTTSGVVFVDNGVEYLILTSYEGYKNASHDRISVVFNGGKSAEATVFKMIPEVDLILLSVDYREIDSYLKGYVQLVSIGDSSFLDPGSVVVALGCPNGRESSVDIGFVTSKSSKAYITDNSLEILDTSMIGGRGEGGILVNSKGALVGFITNRFRENESTLQAISYETVEKILTYSVNDIAYPEFGARFYDIAEEVLDSLSMQNGILIESVKEDSEAARQQFRQGDIITQINGTPVTSVREFFEIYSVYEQNEEVEFTYYRNGKKNTKKWKITIEQ